MTEFELATTQTLQELSAIHSATAQKVSDLHRELLGNGAPGRIQKIEEKIKSRDSLAIKLVILIVGALITLGLYAADNWHEQAIHNSQPPPAAVRK